ncbi:hypothetical protein DF196_01810 [Bifidobacterium callitrichidarum]|uniref:Uncharacterized protein n=1 Tax=Bifidobacterium callitrichidarum TaxID=2052941 RepID=A0A2U2NC13_9BIFI|nr:hypothetical protein DF196_01810 [Bifidobacterium callitrichidarum]
MRYLPLLTIILVLLIDVAGIITLMHKNFDRRPLLGPVTVSFLVSAGAICVMALIVLSVFYINFP